MDKSPCATSFQVDEYITSDETNCKTISDVTAKFLFIIYFCLMRRFSKSAQFLSMRSKLQAQIKNWWLSSLSAVDTRFISYPPIDPISRPSAEHNETYIAVFQVYSAPLPGFGKIVGTSPLTMAVTLFRDPNGGSLQPKIFTLRIRTSTNRSVIA